MVLLLHVFTNLTNELFLINIFYWCFCKIRCPKGQTPTNDGKACIDLNECDSSNPCLNGGTCYNLDKGEGFLCSCTIGFEGKYCNYQRLTKTLSLSNAALMMIIICLVNIMSK